MRVSVQENPVKPGTYRLVLHTGRNTSFDQFLDYASGSSTLSRADILAVFQAASEWLLITARQGREASFGPIGRTRLGMKGQFDRMPERIDDADVRLTMNWVLPGEITKQVAGIGKELVRQRVMPRSKRPNPQDARRVLPDASLDPVPRQYEPGCTMMLFGRNLDYDTSQADEGVFLIDEGGTATRIPRVYTLEPSQVMFPMPEDATGTYHVQVRRRHFKGKGNPLIGRMENSLMPI